MVTVYGIPNCDTVKRARRWLDAHGVRYRFHDLRRDGLDAAMLDRWAAAAGWEALLNRRGTSWRRLAEADRAGVEEGEALRLMLAHPTLIKRPVVETGAGAALVGFAEASFTATFG